MLFSPMELDRTTLTVPPCPVGGEDRTYSYKFNSNKLRWLKDEMCRLMEKHRGVGLAANQLNEDAQMFIWMDDCGFPRCMCNPEKLEPLSGVTKEGVEGCLSLPHAAVSIARYDTIRIIGSDIFGLHLEIEASGMEARIIQHEYDHLQGKTIIDYAG